MIKARAKKNRVFGSTIEHGINVTFNRYIGMIKKVTDICACCTERVCTFSTRNENTYAGEKVTGTAAFFFVYNYIAVVCNILHKWAALKHCYYTNYYYAIMKKKKKRKKGVFSRDVVFGCHAKWYVTIDGSYRFLLALTSHYARSNTHIHTFYESK